MTVLVTGGGGFLGLAIAEALAASGKAVVLADLRFPAELAAWLPGATVCRFDVTDHAAVAEVLRAHRIEHVVHAAAVTTVADDGPGGLDLLFRVNIETTDPNIGFAYDFTGNRDVAAINYNIDVTNPANQFPIFMGAPWTHGQHCYQHVSPPNSRSCGWLPSLRAAMTPSSRHTSGVNVLYGDGHSAFATDGIDTSAWRATATRAGGEVASGTP